MKRMILPSALAAAAICSALWITGQAVAEEPSAPANQLLAWPPVTREMRPWTRWWWMGSAVDPENLARELQRYRQAGLGGVEITPIYGVRGREDQSIDYLSPRWMEMLAQSVRAADSLDMGVDMPTGTGWCFGGPNVLPRDANASLVCRTVAVLAGQRMDGVFDPATTQALVAYPTQDGPAVDITAKIAADGSADWSAPSEGAPWTVYAITQKPSGVVVKRPAPGGAGPMLNLLYGSAMDRYLQRFTAAFDRAGKDAPRPAGMFHDSYEYRSDWAPDFLAQFEKHRGYKLQDELPALFGSERSDHVARVKSDYRETVSDIMVEESLPAWTRWAHEHGFTTREQAHGSPGNWLDLYATADVPETEMFNQDRDVLVSKFASSAAHVTGRNLVGAEAGTWVAEHFTETLADLKSVVDDLFLSGVNRVTFHGTAYSPDDAPWPGWCFYAATELNPRNALWHDLPALNAYITRAQSLLQTGRSDNDVWLYWPIHDRWHDAEGLMQPFTIHGRDWFHEQPVGAVARFLYENGYQYDYVSDRQLAAPGAAGQDLRRRIVAVPKCGHLPADTFSRLLKLAEGGATVIFQDQFPADVPGYGQLEKRRQNLRQAQRSFFAATSAAPGQPLQYRYGAGQVMVGDLAAALKLLDTVASPLPTPGGLRWVRRTWAHGQTYFVLNTGDQAFDQWVSLGERESAGSRQDVFMDALTGTIGEAEIRQAGDRREVHIQLDPGATVFLRTCMEPVAMASKWLYHRPEGDPIQLGGKWQVRFVQGGPQLPAATEISQLVSWTSLGDPAAQTFAGTALYTLKFDLAEHAKGNTYSLDLGELRSSARIRLNGEDLGTTFSKPYRVWACGLKAQGNTLEIEVTGTSANRIRDLDVRKAPWKIFYDANVVTKDYKPFDASKWPLSEQGLIGPVTLQKERPSE